MQEIHFWRWFIAGSGGLPGWRRIVSPWLLLHGIVGAIAAYLNVDVQKSAQAVLIPLSGVFVGLTFAWVANVQATLQSDEIAILARYKPGGFADYVFTFQLGMLLVLASIFCWGAVALEVPGLSCSAQFPGHDVACSRAVTGILFATVSLALRECWHLISGSMLMMISRDTVRERLVALPDPSGKNPASASQKTSDS